MTQQPPADTGPRVDADLFVWPLVSPRYRVAVEDAAREHLRERFRAGNWTLDGHLVDDRYRLAELARRSGRIGAAITGGWDDTDLRQQLVELASVTLTWASILPRRAD